MTPGPTRQLGTLVRRRWVRKGLLVVLGLAIAGILSEGLLRAFFPYLSPRTAVLSQFWRPDPFLGWSHIPHAKGLFSAFGSTTSVSINANGFRDSERSYDRDPSKYRIAVLGDSVVWGYGVEQDEMFTALMERWRKNIEVINLGVSGYGTDQELILLQREGVRYRPDLIIVVFVENDFDGNARKSVYLLYQKPMFELNGDGRLELTNIPVPAPPMWKRAASALIRRSFVANLVASTYYRCRYECFRMTPPAAESGTASSKERPPFPRDVAERITAALLLEMERQARRMGAEFVLVLADGMGRRGAEMEEFFRSRYTRVFNLDSHLGKKATGELYLPDGAHWSAAGHEEVARSLLKYLEDENLIMQGRVATR